MICLIPAVKSLTTFPGAFTPRKVCYETAGLDGRLVAALKKLPYDPAGAPLSMTVGSEETEAYTLQLTKSGIAIQAGGPAGAFYALQTLRQLLTHEQLPCLQIEDYPDFPYRGFYHDVTRGKIPTVATLKQLIDQMAYYKLNSLQLYVEHTYAFEEYRQLQASTGCLTKEELQELGEYCRENFIDFIPSLSTFGHLYELLEQPQYRHLRVLKNYEAQPNFWNARMLHHTIDPQMPQSLALVESLINQYVPCFESRWFNICCDETFDLQSYDARGVDSGKLYVDFVKKLIACVEKHGKQVMMWADIVLKYPETIRELPPNTVFLNWEYNAEPSEEKVACLARSGRKQILCPGTSTWSRFCENVDREEQNICHMAQYARRHGAWGILNTNWGDWGNPCSLELAMYGLVLGAEKSWSVDTPVDAAFYSRVDGLLYGTENAMEQLKALSRLHSLVNWKHFCSVYFYHRYGQESNHKDAEPDLAAVQKAYTALTRALSGETWRKDEYRQEMLLAAEGLCVTAELWATLLGQQVDRLTDTGRWLQAYSEKWLQKNQPSELYRIREVFEYCQQAARSHDGADGK